MVETDTGSGNADAGKRQEPQTEKTSDCRLALREGGREGWGEREKEGERQRGRKGDNTTAGEKNIADVGVFREVSCGTVTIG